jgi:hypothetical protein
MGIPQTDRKEAMDFEIVIASEAKQSGCRGKKAGLLRCKCSSQ